jgi:hypothetical protein
MAQIYSYPQVEPLSTDLLIGSRIDTVNDTQVTYNFSVNSISSLVNTDGLTTTSVNVSSAEIQQLHVTDKVLVPAQGANLCINVISASIYITGGTVYTFGAPISIKINGVSMGSIPQAQANSGTALVYKMEVPAGIVAANKALVLTAAGAGGTGTGTYRLSIKYEVLQEGNTF